MNYYDDRNLYQQISLTGNGLSLYARIMHRFMEKQFEASDRFSEVLEIGSDQGQHRSFVRHSYTRYIQCDLHLPSELNQDFRVESVLGDIRQLPFENKRFDRVIVTCVLHHLSDPELPLLEIARVTKPGGAITLLFPRDPSPIYSLARNLLMSFKHRSMTKMREYNRLHKQQHIGDYRVIMDSVKANNRLFKVEELRRLPFPPLTLLYCYSLNRV